MARKKILIVEDEQDIIDLIELNLVREGYDVISARSGEDGIILAERERPDLVLLDLMLPGIDGMDVCKRLKLNDRTRHVPVIMLTAKDDETDIVCGLEVGAEDYITKPFSIKVLVAHIRAVLRRLQESVSEDPAVFKAGDLLIDKSRYEVRAADMRIDLTPTEFQLFLVLAHRPGWVFSRTQLIDAVRGSNVIITDRAIDVHIAALRKKLGEYGDLIQTVRGVGYRFREV